MAATWLGELNIVKTPERDQDPLVSGLKQLLLRVVFGFLLLLVSKALLPHLTYFDGEATQGWREFLPLLSFVLALLSLRASILLMAAVLGWAILYYSPAAVIWYVFMLLLLLGVYEDRREHALLLAATPGLLLLNLGFLPTFLVGIFYGAKRGLMNGFGCVTAIAIAAVLGRVSFDSIVLTGFPVNREALIAAPYPPTSILDFSWITTLTWDAGTAQVAALATRWAETLVNSPVALALPLLWGFAAIAIHQTRQASDLILGRLGVADWSRSLLAQGTALLVGVLLLVFGYLLIISDAQRAIIAGAFQKQLINSAFVTLVVVISTSAFHIFVEERRFALASWAPQLATLLRRLNIRGAPSGRPVE